MYRRMMLGCIHDPMIILLAIIVTGLEEVAVRCTMVQRDRFFDPEIANEDAAELAWRRKVWATAAAMGMNIEVTAILASWEEREGEIPDRKRKLDSQKTRSTRPSLHSPPHAWIDVSHRVHHHETVSFGQSER